MKRGISFFLGAIAVAFVATTAQAEQFLKGYYTYKPYPGTQREAMEAAATGATIPLSNTTFYSSKTSPPQNFSAVIVGDNPFASRNVPMHVKVLLVPMEIHIGSQVFDSTAHNPCGGSMGKTDFNNFLNSPIISPVAFDGGIGAGHAALVNGINMGSGTYVNTHRRAEFLGAIGGPSSNYGVLLMFGARRSRL